MAEYLELAKEWALLLFRPAEWHVLVVMALVVTALTETAKRALYMHLPPTKKRRAVYLTSAGLSAVVAVIAWLTTTGDIRPWVWWVAAATVGPVTNFLHWVTMGIVAWRWPGAAKALQGTRR